MAPRDLDEPAFRRLFDSAYRPLLAYARRRAESTADAEEVVAETLLVAWRRRLELPADDPLPWLYGVARRVLANQRRGRERLGRLRSALAGSPRSPGDGPAERAESRAATRTALGAGGRPGPPGAGTCTLGAAPEPARAAADSPRVLGRPRA